MSLLDDIYSGLNPEWDGTVPVAPIPSMPVGTVMFLARRRAGETDEEYGARCAILYNIGTYEGDRP